MTEAVHHPHADLLLACATGALDPATALVVETHGALCETCGRQLATYAAIGGALVDSVPPVDVSEGLFDRLMARIDAEPVAPMRGDFVLPETMSELAALPSVVRGMARDALESRGWKRMGPGLLTLDLVGPSPEPNAPEVQLIRLEPGAAGPRHTHRGLEFTQVMTGAFRDEVSRYGPGDFSIGSPDLTHQPVAENDGVCIALSVTTAPVQLTGVLGLIQRALGH